MLPTSSVLERVIQTQQNGISEEVARFIMSLALAESDQRRCVELSDKAQGGALSKDEAAELDDLLTTNDLLTILKSRARIKLNRAPASAA